MALSTGSQDSFFSVVCKTVIELQEGGIVHPYRIRKLNPQASESEFVFSLSYTSVQEWLAKVSRWAASRPSSHSPALLTARRLHQLARSGLDRAQTSDQLAALIRSKEGQTQFDTTWWVPRPVCRRVGVAELGQVCGSARGAATRTRYGALRGKVVIHP